MSDEVNVDVELVKAEAEKDIAQFKVTVRGIMKRGELDWSISPKIAEEVSRKYADAMYEEIIKNIDKKELSNLVMTKAMMLMSEKLSGMQNRY